MCRQPASRPRVPFDRETFTKDGTVRLRSHASPFLWGKPVSWGATQEARMNLHFRPQPKGGVGGRRCRKAAKAGCAPHSHLRARCHLDLALPLCRSASLPSFLLLRRSIGVNLKVTERTLGSVAGQPSLLRFAPPKPALRLRFVLSTTRTGKQHERHSQSTKRTLEREGTARALPSVPRIFARC